MTSSIRWGLWFSQDVWDAATVEGRQHRNLVDEEPRHAFTVFLEGSYSLWIIVERICGSVVVQDRTESILVVVLVLRRRATWDLLRDEVSVVIPAVAGGSLGVRRTEDLVEIRVGISRRLRASTGQILDDKFRFPTGS